MQEPILKIENINKKFSGVSVLEDITLGFYPGEVHCLMGENGAGKSTLIKIISGAYKADFGKIQYHGEELSNIDLRWARNNGINTIYQEIDLVPHLTAIENILLGEEPVTSFGSIDKRKAKAQCKELFEQLGVDIELEVPVRSLQLAQQQMVAIAKAMYMKSKVIIFDEPTAVFTSREVHILFKIIRDFREKGVAIIYISHHMDEIFEIGDRISVLRDGKLIHTGAKEEFTKESLIKEMVGRNIVFKHSGKQNSVGEVVLEVKNLYAGKLVNNVSFQLHKNEVLGFGGLVGAGRTETMRALIGMEKYESGEIYLKGKKVIIKNPRAALKRGIQMLPESRKDEGIVGERPVGDNISYSYIEKITKLGLIKWKKVRKKEKEIVESMTVKPNEVKKLIRYLSGGNQQKAVLGRLVAADCEVLILDEPTRGVDVGARTEIYDVIQKMKNSGKAIIMVSSDMTELLTQSDRIIVMSEGSIAGEVDGAEATEEKVLSSALHVEVK